MPSSSQTQAPRRRGGPTGPRVPLRERLERHTDRSGDCWPWTGRIDQEGYGQIAVDRRPRLAHRVAYEEFIGPIPDGLQVDHLCHNADLSCPGRQACLHRRCINPEHLEAVTAAVNTARARAGRDIGSQGPGWKTECIRGHAFDEENTHWSPTRRYCNACRRIRTRKNESDNPKRLTADHRKAAANLRAEPGKWSLIAAYSKPGTAYQLASVIRGGRLSAYEPKGAFEAEFRTVDAEHRVYARFVGSAQGGTR